MTPGQGIIIGIPGEAAALRCDRIQARAPGIRIISTVTNGRSRRRGR